MECYTRVALVGSSMRPLSPITLTSTTPTKASVRSITLPPFATGESRTGLPPGGSLVNLYGALIFNWRGAMSSRSAKMCSLMGISKSDMKLMSVCVVEWGSRIYRHFHKGTAVG